MKKSAIIILILFLLPLMSAVEFEMKTNLSQGETMMAKVSGNFIEPILKENILFYRGHVRIPVDVAVMRIENEFYIYAELLGKTPDSYSIVIQNVQYREGTQIIEEDIVQNFSIIDTMADFSINPGFMFTKDDFYIKVQNLQNNEITIQIKTKDVGSFIHQDTISLKSGEIKKINFELQNIEQQIFETIELSSENLKYEIPVYLFVIKTDWQETQKSLKLEPSELIVSMPTNSHTSRFLYLYNLGNETLENISLSLSDSLKPYLSFSWEETEKLEGNSNAKIELFFSSDENKTIEGKITAQSAGFYSISDVSLKFIQDYIPLDEDNQTPVYTSKTCVEIGGKICSEDEKCDEEQIYAKDNVCCLGTCKKVQKSSIGIIIGWGIFFVLILFVIWFYKKKYHKPRKPVDLLKIARGKHPKISKRRKKS
ncbi:hypothetical protein KAR52_01335 [Candidatus Pacearchaeota archaeon]|nr:hypothetical protein [Candidatus Pacearchaeota archaeon]